MRYKRLMAVMALLLLGNLVWASPALAMDEPDETPTVEQIDVYRNLLETGDRLYLVYANIPYATTPDTPMPYAFMWNLMDGVDVLGTTTGFAYYADGYGYNVFGLYFSAADNLTWEEEYTLQLVGNPAVFAIPPEWNYTVGTTDYTTFTTSADNKAALAERIIVLASLLDIRWGLTGSDSLLYESETGTVLSIYGETVFRGAIYGVQALAPAAFRLVIEDIEAADRVWNENYASNLSSQYTGTWIEPHRTGGAALFGLGYDLMSIIIAIILGALLVYANIVLTGEAWAGFIDLGIFLVAAPRVDLIPLSFTALICAIMVMYQGTRIKNMVT